MTNPIIYVVLNGELKMSPGKAASQAVHASMMLGEDARSEFSEEVKRTVIVLEAKTGLQLMNLYTYMQNLRLDCDYYIDEGFNEVDPYSITAFAAGPIDSEDTEMREIFAPFNLYQGHIEVHHSNRWGFDQKTVVVENHTDIDSKFAFNEIKKASR